MPQQLDSISRFSPGNCAPELLESILVGQQQLVDRLEKVVIDSVETGAGHHWLLVSPRGTGKTHLLAILFNRINGNREIRDRLAIAYMKEEERGVASFLDWLVRILRAFERRDERHDESREDFDLKKELKRLTQMPLEQAQKEAESLIIRFVGDRRLLLITENLGEIFSEIKGMGRNGQRRFRDLIQQHPFWIIMASTQTLFEDIQIQQAPFYGFFKINHLRTFSFDETLELLAKLAATEGRDQLRKFFRSETGQGRVRAIHEITGGNPRLLVIFYQFVDRESIEDLAGPFLEMVDNLTAYYQEQMQPLPALQLKIVEFLCDHRSPATVKDIAQSCFITHQTTSAQLKRLSERRVVVSTRVGRQSYYELREPLFRICFEVKENMGYPVRLFIDFLGKFYSVEELKRKYRSASLLLSIYQSKNELLEIRKFNTEIRYIKQAVKNYHHEKMEELKTEYSRNGIPGLVDISATIEELVSKEDYREAVRLADAAFDYGTGEPEFLLKSAIGHRKLGNRQAARERIQKLIHANPENVEAWVEKALIEIDSDDVAAAEDSYRRILEIDGSNLEAIIGLGRIYSKRDNLEDAYGYFLQATQLNPRESKAWRHLGRVQESMKDIDGARRSYRKATELAPDDAKAWSFRGLFELSQGAVASECFEKVTRLEPEAFGGWLALGLAQENTKDIDGARRSYRKATELAPDDANAWLYRGRFEGSQGAYDVAVKYLEKATQLQPENVEGWRFLGLAQENTKDIDGARRSYRKATELAPDDAEAWLYRGRFEGSQGAHDVAVKYLEKVTQLQPENVEGWRFLGLAQKNTKDIDGARRSYRKATELAPDDAKVWLLRGRFEGSQDAHDVAVKCLEKVTQLQPENVVGWWVLGLAQENTKDINGARSSFRRATELAPDDAETWLHRGAFEGSQGVYPVTVDCFDKVTQLQPENVVGWRVLGLAQEVTKDIEGARRSFRRATELAPDDAKAWLYRGSFEGKQGAPDLAIECLEKATRLEPENAKGWMTLGLEQNKIKDIDGARKSYHRAIKLAPYDAGFRIEMGRLEHDQGNHEIALKILKKAESEVQSSSYLFNTLGEVLREMGSYEQAIEYYEKAIELDPSSCFPYFNIAFSLFQSGDLEAGLEQIANSVDAGQDQDWNEPITVCVNDINLHLLIHAPLDQLPDLIERQWRFFEGGQFAESFTEGLIGALTELIKKHSEIELERLTRLRKRVISKLSNEEPFSVVCRLFDIGVKYLETKDIRVLLELPLEERSRLEELLGLSTIGGFETSPQT